MPRFVIIDDSNPSIQYDDGPWVGDNLNTQTFLLSIFRIGDNGPPFNNTLHSVVDDSASFSFNFNGSAVIVYGTSIISPESDTQDPTWECFIDNTSIGSSRPSSVLLNGSSENNWILCGVGPSQIQDGPHLLTVKAKTFLQSFYFDQIQYVPSASVSLNQSLLRIDSSDSAIQYSPGSWQFEDFSTAYTATPALGNLNSSVTDTNGANFTYEFSGTYISMFGFTQSPNQTITSANATIDDEDLIPFSVGSSSILYNQMFFERGFLSPGQHKLFVIYLGNNNTAPLIVNYFVVQDAPFESPTPGQPTATFTIVGGVIGGLVLISLIIALFFLRRYNNRRSNNVPVVNPATTPVLNPTTSTFLPGLGQSDPAPPKLEVER